MPERQASFKRLLPCAPTVWCSRRVRTAAAFFPACSKTSSTLGTQLLAFGLRVPSLCKWEKGRACWDLRVLLIAWRCSSTMCSVMVKQSMKRADVATDPVLTRVMHARQQALKLLANVTYGYTSAGYSGRMPCAEIADAIVQTVGHAPTAPALTTPTHTPHPPRSDTMNQAHARNLAVLSGV